MKNVCELCQLYSPSGCAKLSNEPCLKEAVQLLKDSVTIGDMLTAMFPNLREIEMVLENEDGEDFEVNYDLTFDVSKGWNALYKGSEG